MLENSTTIMHVHSRDSCRGYWCCIHYPSPHHMRILPQVWDGSMMVMYRLCEHGHMHPDPDDPNASKHKCKSKTGKMICDGCCKRPYDIESEAL